MLGRFLSQLRLENGVLKGRKDFRSYTSGLYDSLVWNLPKQDENLNLWPYVLELLNFGECKSAGCATRDEVTKLYKNQIVNGLVLEPPTVTAEWTKEYFSKVLDSCDKTPVAFINSANTQEEDPAWIVNRKDGDGWVLDMVRSADQGERSETFTLDRIMSEVLPSYSDVLHIPIA
jgi:hypothetical protein